MAGSSGTPLATKLGIKEGARVLLLSAPPALRLDLPPQVEVRSRSRGAADVVVAFFTVRKRMEERLPALGSIVFPSGSLWLAWPKKASGVPTDLTDTAVRGAGLRHGLVDTKVCAIDETWSALRFVWRVEDRRSHPPQPPASTLDQ